MVAGSLGMSSVSGRIMVHRRLFSKHLVLQFVTALKYQQHVAVYVPLFPEAVSVQIWVCRALER